jgi:hypothetical protein
MQHMKNLIIALAVLLVLGSTAYGGWYVGPVRAYYAPVAPMYAYPAPVYAPGPQVVYSPVVPDPVMVPGPVVLGRPVVVGPAGKVYIPGRPIRNTVRAVLP